MEQVKDRNRRIVITAAKKTHTGAGSTLLAGPRLHTGQVDEPEETARQKAMLESLHRFFSPEWAAPILGRASISLGPGRPPGAGDGHRRRSALRPADTGSARQG